MYEDLEKKAKKRVEAKTGFYFVAAIFAAISVILLTISMNFGYPESFWIKFPILILGLVLGIIYLATFGLPFSGILSSEWKEKQMEKELDRLYRKEGLDTHYSQELSEEDHLELKELERLKQKWDRRDDFV